MTRAADITTRAEDPIQQEAAGWVALAPDSSDDPDLQDRFSAWLAADPRHLDAYLQLRALWDDPLLTEAAELVAERKVVAVPLRRPWRRGLMGAVAAMVALAVIAPAAGDLWLDAMSDLRSGVGERRSVLLSDGSVVEMNTDTALALDLDGPVREVRLLRGEAHFAVESNPERPFRVIGGQAVVTATGTEFVVLRQAEADSVVLLEGVVSVAATGGDGTAAILQPGDALRIDRDGAQRSSAAGQPAWINGRIAFDNATLASVVAEVDRYLPGRTLVLNGADDIVSGTLLLDQLDSGLATLAASAGVSLRKLPGNIRIVW